MGTWIISNNSGLQNEVKKKAKFAFFFLTNPIFYNLIILQGMMMTKRKKRTRR